MAFWGATVYLLCTVLQPAEWIPIFEGVPLQELVLLMTIPVLAVSNKRFIELLTYPPFKFFLLFIIISILSSRYMGLRYALGTVGYFYIKLFMAMILIVLALDTAEKLEKILKIMVLGAFIVGFLCVRLYHTGEGVGAGIGTHAQVLNWRGAVQWIGTFSGTNTTAMLLIFLLGLNFGLLFLSKSIVSKAVWLSVCLIVLYAFYLTHSRGGFIGLITILGAYFYRRVNINLKVFVPLAIMLGLAVIVLKPQEEGRGLGESSSPERVELFHQSLQVFKNNPVIGIGVGQFARNNPVKKRAHNIYLQQLAETGLVGAVLFSLAFFAGGKNLLVYMRRYKKEDKEFQISSTVLISFIGLAATLFFLSPQSEMPYIMLAFMVALPFGSRINEPMPAKTIWFVLLINVIVVIAVYILVQMFFIIFR